MLFLLLLLFVVAVVIVGFFFGCRCCRRRLRVAVCCTSNASCTPEHNFFILFTIISESCTVTLHFCQQPNCCNVHNHKQHVLLKCL